MQDLGISERVTAHQPQRKPRILWASAYCLLDTSSGASIDAREMLRQLVMQGFDVVIVGASIFDSDKGLSRLPEKWSEITKKTSKIKVVDKPLEHELFVTKSIHRDDLTSQEADQWYALYVRMLDTFKPDIVYFYGGRSLDLLISDEARQRGIPAVMYLANGDYKAMRWCRDVDLIITNSKVNAQYYFQKFGFTATPVGLFIDPTTIKATIQERKNLLFVNPSLEKGVGLMIHVALVLLKKRPDIQLEVVESRGNWHTFVKHITKQLGDPREQLKNVQVTQNTDDMKPVYGRARVLFAPSLCWESAGRVAAEAMLNGIPAIVTDRGGLPEMIGNGGFILKLPDECYEVPYSKLPKIEMLEALTDIIIKLWDDDAFYNDYVKRAQHVGESMNNINVSTSKLIEVLRPLIEKKAGDNSDNFVPERLHKHEKKYYEC